MKRRVPRVRIIMRSKMFKILMRVKVSMLKRGRLGLWSGLHSSRDMEVMMSRGTLMMR